MFFNNWVFQQHLNISCVCEMSQTHEQHDQYRGLFHKAGSTNSESNHEQLIYSEIGNSEFLVPEQLIWVSLINSE